jgi:hypothetical protein
MGRFLVFFALADLAVMVVALIDCLSVEGSEIRALPRAVWVLIILLFTPVGGIAWFVAGRPQRRDPAGTFGGGTGFPESENLRTVTAPDDDPEFLRAIAAKTQQEDRERLRAWEADLREREQELRRRESRPADKETADKDTEDGASAGS